MGSFLLVGGSRDIGLMLAEKLIQRGDKVTLLVRDKSRTAGLPSESVQVLVGDANDESLVLAAVQSCLSLGDGKIDGVAHLVGSFAVRPPHAMNRESFEEVLSTNLVSAFVTLSVACKQMLRTGGGRVVFTSSVAGSLGLVNHEAISAAKGGVESMVRSAAATYSKRGIRVNAVAPGLTETRLSSPITSSESSKDAAVGMIPLNRINKAVEVAETMLWLLTEAPDNITGQVFHLDGGMSKVRS